MFCYEIIINSYAHWTEVTLIPFKCHHVVCRTSKNPAYK